MTALPAVQGSLSDSVEPASGGGHGMELTVLTKATPWYGRYSGYYEQLPRHLAVACDRLSIVSPRRTLSNRLIGKLWGTFRRLPPRDQSLTAAELAFLLRWRSRASKPGFVLAAEEHLPMFAYWQKAPRPLVATIHYPRGLWSDIWLAALRSLSSAIVLYRADEQFFESFVGQDRVRFVPHGVDVDFFRPGDEVDLYFSPRLLFAGQFARDFRLLDQVIVALNYLRPCLKYDVVIPQPAATLPEVRAVLSRSGVCHHVALGDQELRDLYQRSCIMLLPMKESGANNAVVEALACGLPLVTTDVGGIRDYGGGTVFPVAPAGDCDEIVRLVLAYLADPNWRAEISSKQRSFALTHLAWPMIARLHLEAIRDLASVDTSASDRG